MIGTCVSTFSRRALAAVAVLAFAALATPSARAGLVFSTAGTVTVLPGSTNNFFDVIVTNTGNQAENLAAYLVDLSVPAASGISITGVTDETAQPYVFDFTGSGSLGPTPLTMLPGTSLAFFDLTSAPSGPLPSRTIGAGASFGLGRVFFDASNLIPSSTVITFSPPIPTGTSDATSPDGVVLLTGVTNGLILRDTGPVNPVPEPGTLAGAIAGVAGLLIASRSARRRRGATTA
jgi:hypothetical protein